jgi:hypothetical protein
MGDTSFREKISRRTFMAGVAGTAAGAALTPLVARAASVAIGASRQAALLVPQFTDVAQAAGIIYTGKSWGAAWGDFNGDGHLDVWTDNHTNAKSLWINNGNGTFTNLCVKAPATQPFPPGWDTHGACWGDFDNDGHLDLIQLADTADHTTAQPYLLKNTGTQLIEDTANTYGLNGYTIARGRTPLWFDFNGDGLLDLFVPTLVRNGPAGGLTSAVFQQTASGFQNVSAEVGFGVGRNAVQFGVVCHLMGDATPYLLIAEGGVGDVNWGASFPALVYDISTVPWVDVTRSIGIPITAPVNDVVIADFNNDGMLEIFTTGGERPNDVLQFNATTVDARLNPRGTETGFSFVTAGNLSFLLGNSYFNNLSVESVYIGSSGAHPTLTKANTFEFAVSTGPGSEGILAHAVGKSTAIYIGWTASTQTWQVLFDCPLLGDATFEVTSSEAVSSVLPINFDVSAPGGANHYFVNVNGTWTDMATAAGLAVPSQSVNVTAADFNNNGYLDLYVVNTRGAGNLPNDLYMNNGDGTFTHVPNAGGAAGTLIGRGCTATSNDYNEDGNVDVLCTNGRKPDPFVGPYQLFQNPGVGNNWIEVDLIGQAGLAGGLDAYGTRVTATAGSLTMYREKNAGMHERGAQDARRLHFGLGSNSVVTLMITWPNGVTQQIPGLAANQIIAITEPATPVIAVSKPPSIKVLKAPADAVAKAGGAPMPSAEEVAAGDPT